MAEGLKFKIFYAQGVSEVDCFDLPCIVGRSMECEVCLLYTSPSPRDQRGSRMPSSA